MATNKEFESFNGQIVLTTNCLIPVKKDNTYLDRLFTTGVVNYPSAAHIADRSNGGSKDFTPVIEMAKKCQAPEEILLRSQTSQIRSGPAPLYICSKSIQQA